jgi:signal transduction histidine kinase
LVSRTLKFAGPSSSEREKFDLHTVLEHSLNLIGPRIKTQGIHLTKALEATRAGLVGSSAQLQQACVNLLLNAVEAMGQGGRLLVGTRDVPLEQERPGSSAARGRDWIECTITDSGRGLTPEEQAKLFEPFFTTKPSGTGLGLAITRRIIEEHSGSISVRSKAGEGATFTVRLPLDL